jgi:2-keto-4-pentenoate hydratase
MTPVSYIYSTGPERSDLMLHCKMKRLPTQCSMGAVMAAIGTQVRTPAGAIAGAFVRARLAGASVAEFPGKIPVDLDDAYQVQDTAIEQWPSAIVGWKVGMIGPNWFAQYGEDRLLGPIFRSGLRPAADALPVDFPVFAGGFAAVEGEFVFRLATDAPKDKIAWTTDEAADLVGALHVGVEIASSPLATINALGPAVIVSDFGNNAGLLLGPIVSDWRKRALDSLPCETFISGQSVGRGSAASIAGGPLAALAFALGRSARRGRPLRAGDLISTGAASGVHDIQIGQMARIDFGSCGEIHCRAVRAQNISADTGAA